MRWTVWMLWMLGGCGLSESAYRDEFAVASCERSSVCSVESGGQPRDCSTVAGVDSELFNCDFDADAAQSCLDAVPAAPCQGAGFTNPPSCAQVLTGCTPN